MVLNNAINALEFAKEMLHPLSNFTQIFPEKLINFAFSIYVLKNQNQIDKILTPKCFWQVDALLYVVATNEEQIKLPNFWLPELQISFMGGSKFNDV